MAILCHALRGPRVAARGARPLSCARGGPYATRLAPVRQFVCVAADRDTFANYTPSTAKHRIAAFPVPLQQAQDGFLTADEQGSDEPLGTKGGEPCVRRRQARGCAPLCRPPVSHARPSTTRPQRRRPRSCSSASLLRRVQGPFWSAPRPSSAASTAWPRVQRSCAPHPAAALRSSRDAWERVSADLHLTRVAWGCARGAARPASPLLRVCGRAESGQRDTQQARRYRRRSAPTRTYLSAWLFCAADAPTRAVRERRACFAHPAPR